MAVRNDMFCLPMCANHHRIQHEIGEFTFYKKYNINPIWVAEYFAKQSPCLKVKNESEGYYDKHREYFRKSD